MTTRGLIEHDFDVICEFIDEMIKLTININSNVEGKKLKDFKDAVAGQDEEINKQLDIVKKRVTEFSSQFNTFGY